MYLPVLLSFNNYKNTFNIHYINTNYVLELTGAINIEIVKRNDKNFLLMLFQRSNCNYGLAVFIPGLLDVFLPFYDYIKTMLFVSFISY